MSEMRFPISGHTLPKVNLRNRRNDSAIKSDYNFIVIGNVFNIFSIFVKINQYS